MKYTILLGAMWGISFLLCGTPSLAKDVELGVVPNISTRDLEGEKFDLYTQLEAGPAVITFWATWCKPCRKELPELQKLLEKYAEQGFQVIAINGDGPVDQAKVRPYISANKFEFVIVPDPNGELRRRFQVEVFPTTVLVDAEGQILHRQVGYRRGDEKIIEKELLEFLLPAGEDALPDPEPESGR